MRKIIAALVLLASALSSSFAQTGPKFGKNGGVGSASSTFSGGEPTGGTYAVNGTTGQASFGGVNFKPQSVAPSSPANGDCWLLVNSGLYCRVGSNTIGPFAQRYAPLVADAYAGGDAVTTSGSQTFTSAGRACVAADAGKIIAIAGAAAANAPLKTTVASCSGSAYVLSVAAGATVSAQQWGIGTDNSALLNTLVANNPRSTIELPPGAMLLDATTVNLNNVTLRGQSVSTRGVLFNNPTAYGTTFLLTSATQQPFTVLRGVRITNVQFLWPGQSGIIATPVAYPPLFLTNAAGMGDFWFTDNTVLNAYDFFTQHPNCNGEGGLHVETSNIYAIRRGFSVCAVGETHSINSSIFNPSVYYEGTVNQPNQYLIKWSLANGDWIYAFGNGDATTCSSTVIGGFLIGSGTTINGYRRAFHVNGGILDETVLGGATDINGVHQIIVVEPNGFVSHMSLLGHMYPNGKPGLRAEYPAFDFQGTCSSGYPGDFTVGGRLIGPEFTVFNVAGTNLQRLGISVDVKNYGDNSIPTTPMYFANINNPNVAVNITGSMIRSQFQGSNNRGILVSSARSFNFTGNTCENVYRCVDVTGLAANKYTVIAGNNATGSADTYSAYGTLGASITAFGNTFDRPNPGFDALQGGQQSTNSWVSMPVYYVPTANGQTYTWLLGNHQLTIDSVVNTVTTATVALPAAPADGYVVKMAPTSNLTTFTVTPAAGDVSKCGAGSLNNGQSLSCVFRRGIGATTPNGAWFTY